MARGPVRQAGTRAPGAVHLFYGNLTLSLKVRCAHAIDSLVEAAPIPVPAPIPAAGASLTRAPAQGRSRISVGAARVPGSSAGEVRPIHRLRVGDAHRS